MAAPEATPIKMHLSPNVSNLSDGNAWEIYIPTDDLLEDHEHDHEGNPLPAEGTPSSTALSVPLLDLAGSSGQPGLGNCCRDHGR